MAVVLNGINANDRGDLFRMRDASTEALAPVPISKVCDKWMAEMRHKRRVRILAGGTRYDLAPTTTAVGPQPGGGEMVADLSRFLPGDNVRILGNEGHDFRAVIA